MFGSVGSVVARHAGAFEEGVDAAHGGERFGVNGLRMGQRVAHEAHGQAKPAVTGVEDDATDHAHFTVQQAGARFGIEIAISILRRDFAQLTGKAGKRSDEYADCRMVRLLCIVGLGFFLRIELLKSADDIIVLRVDHDEHKSYGTGAT